MYMLGWEMGAVEAISLSILVGSSVDYCLHLVEGYLLAGGSLPETPSHSLVGLARKHGEISVAERSVTLNHSSIFEAHRFLMDIFSYEYVLFTCSLGFDEITYFHFLIGAQRRRTARGFV